MRNYKSLFLLFIMTFMMIALVGCGSKIELSFEEETYTVEVGEEITLDPIVINEDNKEFSLVYSSEKPETATYIDGKVTGVAVGETKIKVTLEGNEKIFAETTINVIAKPKFTVTFNTNGGSAISAVEVEKDDKVTQPEDPTKVGHEFEGWFTSSAFTTPYNFDTPVTAAITLYAKWDINQYTVTFEVFGGSNIEPLTVNHGDSISQLPEDPEREFSTFIGWYSDEACENEFVFAQVITSDITIYAKWELFTYEVVFNSNGGSNVDVQTVAHGDKATEPEDPTRDGFTFVGWFSDSAFENEFDFDTEITGITALFAKWELDSLDAKLMVKGGEIDGMTLILAPVDGVTPVTQDLGFFNTGYGAANAETSIWLYEGDHSIFGGAGESQEGAHWGYKVALTQIAANTFMVEKNLANESDCPQGVYDYVLVGLWRPNVYPGFTFLTQLVAGDVLIIEGVDYGAEPGPVEATITKYKATEINYHYELSIEVGTELPTPTKRGFVFDGWYNNKALTGEKVTTVSNDNAASEFYAKWVDAERLEVSFVTGVEGIVIHPVYRFEGEIVKRPADPVREGYTLEGWYIDEETTAVFNFDTPINENITLYAKWVEAEGEDE